MNIGVNWMIDTFLSLSSIAKERTCCVNLIEILMNMLSLREQFQASVSWGSIAQFVPFCLDKHTQIGKGGKKSCDPAT